MRLVRLDRFKRIVFLNGHYDNTYAIAYACANAAERLPEGVKAFPVNYWDGMTADEAAEFSGLKNGLHANAAETSAILAIDPELVDMERANAEFPPFPEFTEHGRRAHRVLLLAPGLGLLGDGVRDVGRRPRVDGGIRRALPRRSWSRRRSACSTTSRGPTRRCRPARSRTSASRSAVRGHPGIGGGDGDDDRAEQDPARRLGHAEGRGAR